MLTTKPLSVTKQIIDGWIWLLILPGVIAAFVTPSLGAEPMRRTIPVCVATAKTAQGGSDLRFSANITPRKQVNLAFKVGGYIHDIAMTPGPHGALREIRAGDRVTRGMILTHIAPKDYVVRVNQAKAALEGAKASLEMAEKNFHRYQKLVENGYIAKSDFDRAQEGFDGASARVDASQAQLEQAEIQLDDCTLKSPIDGVVVRRTIEHGSLVAGGTLAFVLVDLNDVKAIFGVPDGLLPRFHLGDSLPVVVDALNHREFRGAVTAISPAADVKSRVFDIEVTIQNPNGILKDGMIAAVRVEDTPSSETHMSGQADNPLPEGAVVIPLQSVVRPPDTPDGYMVFVVVQQNGRTIASARRVKLGNVAGRSIIALHGLSAGDRVITTGATIVYDGAAVNVAP